MTEFFLAFLILLATVTAMSVGVLRGRKPISGSCGGLNNLSLDGGCEICGGDAAKCEQPDKITSGDAFYPASSLPAATRRPN